MFQAQGGLFPLTGPGAILTGGLEFVIVFLSLQSFAFFFIKYFQSASRPRTARNLAWNVLLLGLAGEYIAWIYGDYFTTNPRIQDIANTAGYLTLCSAALFMLAITEHIERSRHRPFSIAGGILFGLIIVTLVMQVRLAVPLMTIGTSLAIAYFIHYFRKLVKVANYNRAIINFSSILLCSLFLVLAGIILISDFWLPLVGLTARIISGWVVLAGINLFLFTLERVPGLEELDWITKIRSLLVIYENGLPLFSRSWNAGTITQKDDMYSGVFLVVDAVLKEITGQEKTNIVTLENQILLFEYRDHFICVIVADEILQSLQIRLKQFSDEFATLFAPVLAEWKGNTEVFLPAETIADSIFAPS